MTNMRHVKSSVRVSRRWATLLAALSLVLSLGTPSDAAAQSTLTISGTHSGWVEIKLNKPTSFDDRSVTVTGKGRYIGLFLDSITRVGDDYGWIHFRDTSPYSVKEETGGGVGLGTQDTDPLPAGRYRAYLLTEGPGSISIPVLSGTTTLRLHPTHAVRPRYRYVALHQTLAPGVGGPFSASASFPIDFTPHSVAITEIGASWTVPAMTARINACFVKAGDSDCFPTVERLMDRGFVVTGAGGGKMEKGAYTVRDYVPYGHLQALFTAESSTELSRLHAAVLDNFL